MKRIYHPFWLWEDYKKGFYDNISRKNKIELCDKVKQMFSSEEETRKYMELVTSEWKYSCEHNLSNESLNRIAYIGQAACCIYAGVPSSITMECWSKLELADRERADKIANEVLQNWIENNKRIQLCLNLD